MTQTPAPSWTAGEHRRRIEAHGWALELVDASFDHLVWRSDGILRALRVVVRDQDWRTVPAVVDGVSIDEGADETTIRLTAHIDDLGVTAEWVATLRLREGGLRLDVDFAARNAFVRNRIGVVVLHSPDLAGRRLAVSHPDGTVTDTVFPRDIAPHQPAVDIRGLTWSTDRTDATLRLNGDVFEMEDQRNWTDASFKTYSTPLALPFPVEVSPGDRVTQSLELSVVWRSDGPVQDADTVEHGLGLGLVATATTVPRILVGAATAPGRPPRRPGWLARVGVLAELDLRDPGWSRALTRARQDAGSEPLDIRLVASEPDQLDAAVAALCGAPIVRLAVVDAVTHVTTPALWQRLQSLAAQEPITGELVGGTRAHFTELNRNHGALPHGLGGLIFSITPQMHDVSTDQVTESIGEQRRVVEQAVRIAAGRSVHVGPVTLRARFNAVATSAHSPGPADVDQHGYGAELVWNATDPRQQTDEYATWMLASAVALVVPGVASIALAEAWGPRGFGTAAGAAFPAAEVLGWLAEVQGGETMSVQADRIDAGVAVLAARSAEGVVVLAANASPGSTRLTIESLGVDLELGPWGRARVHTSEGPSKL